MVQLVVENHVAKLITRLQTHQKGKILVNEIPRRNRN